MAMRFGMLAAITFAFPFFVYWVVDVSGARHTDAAGALAMMLGIFLKPIIYLLFALSTLRLSLWRAGSIGISPKIGLCISLLVLCDLSFGTTFGSFWAVGFALGVLYIKLPASLFAAVIAMVTLCLLQDFKQPMTGRVATLYRIWKGLLFIFLGLGLIELASFALPWLLGLIGIRTSFGFRYLLMMPTGYLKYYLFYPLGVLIPFAAVSAALVIENRRATPDNKSRVGALFRNKGALLSEPVRIKHKLPYPKTKAAGLSPTAFLQNEYQGALS
ncbi:hypothetical protein DY251_12015 [Mesorhizobium denitrificans]|uniref:Uncharacterized protein n=2 Tax=Phyllobacteriaceae TaxID=69277 RepID=A0A371XDH5_9HYPH|nr:hypothetical protein DY251_12015 [Mesorhizobium denitrificans]